MFMVIPKQSYDNPQTGAPQGPSPYMGLPLGGPFATQDAAETAAANYAKGNPGNSFLVVLLDAPVSTLSAPAIEVAKAAYSV